MTYSYQCFSRAGYLSGVETVGAVFIGLFSLGCTIALTFRLRHMASEALALFRPKTGNNGSGTNPATEHPCAAGAGVTDSSTPIPTGADSPSNQLSRTDAPPPYNSEHFSDPSTTHQTSPSIPIRTKDARWRAQTFASSTLYLAALIVSVTTLGFALQNLWYCPHITASEDKTTFWKCLVWLLYTLLVIFATSGLVAWIIKFLALWGPNTEVGRGRILDKTIEVDMAIYGLIFIPVSVWYGVVELVLACQRFFCPGASEEYEEIDVEDLEMGGSLENSVHEEPIGK